ncbi:MAG: hypothetical protein WCB68_06385 [Pyrinomonadaceae bacterium]
MKLRSLSTCLIFACLLVAACFSQTQAQQHGEHAETPSSNTSVTVDELPVPAGWNKFAPAGNAFSVLLPSKPEESVARTPVSAGITLTTHAYTVTTDDGVYLVAVMSDLPLVAEKMTDAYKQSFYDGMWKGMAEGIREELEKNGLVIKLETGAQRSVVVGGLQGREQDFTVGSLGGRTQMALTGQRAYLTMAFWTNEEKTAVERAAFFNSFQIGTRR